jgi:hypothetical protein
MTYQSLAHPARGASACWTPGSFTSCPAQFNEAPRLDDSPYVANRLDIVKGIRIDNHDIGDIEFKRLKYLAGSTNCSNAFNDGPQLSEHGRSAYLGIGVQTTAVAGAAASARLYSLIETAKACSVEPHAYLSHLFANPPTATTADHFEALLPWNITPAPARIK